MHSLIMGAAFMTAAAFPAEAQTITIDTPSLIDLFTEPVLGIVSALGVLFMAWIAELVRRFVGLKIEAQHREAFQTALENGAGHLIAELKARSGKITIDAKNELIAHAANVVIASVPDAVKKFDLTRETVEQKVLDKLAIVAPEALPEK